MLIEARSLGFTYAPHTPLARVALQAVNLTFAAGQRVGLVGATGSGKSTLVQLAAGLRKPTAGLMLLDGVPAHGSGRLAATRRRKVGIAFQYPESQIFERTVAREVAFGPRHLKLEAAEVAERVQWALDLVGLNGSALAERVPLSLSGGEMRRVALAGVLALQPEVLILDEATAGLDPQGRRDLLERILGWQRQTGATLLMVSHDLDQLARVAERVVVLAAGSVVADGPAQRVLSDLPLLRAHGLDAPQPARLLWGLRAAGWPVRTDCLLPAAAAAEIVAAKHGMGAAP
jgi:energy-coupling factor transport system ATP-binding protein